MQNGTKLAYACYLLIVLKWLVAEVAHFLLWDYDPPYPSSLKKASSISESFYAIILRACFLLLSMMNPPIIISSRMKYA